MGKDEFYVFCDYFPELSFCDNRFLGWFQFVVLSYWDFKRLYVLSFSRWNYPLIDLTPIFKTYNLCWQRTQATFVVVCTRTQAAGPWSTSRISWIHCWLMFLTVFRSYSDDLNSKTKDHQYLNWWFLLKPSLKTMKHALILVLRTLVECLSKNIHDTHFPFGESVSPKC